MSFKVRITKNDEVVDEVKYSREQLEVLLDILPYDMDIIICRSAGESKGEKLRLVEDEFFDRVNKAISDSKGDLKHIAQEVGQGFLTAKAQMQAIYE